MAPKLPRRKPRPLRRESQVDRLKIDPVKKAIFDLHLVAELGRTKHAELRSFLRQKGFTKDLGELRLECMNLFRIYDDRRINVPPEFALTPKEEALILKQARTFRELFQEAKSQGLA